MPSVYPLVLVPASFQGHFPNMAKRDEVVWRRFLAAHAQSYLAFAYDVALGGVVHSLPDADPADVKAWQYKTALKIDVVAIGEKEAWIIEVKPDAHVSAIGACVVYTLVAEREQVFDRPLRAAVVCEYAQPDVQWAAERLGISVIVV